MILRTVPRFKNPVEQKYRERLFREAPWLKFEPTADYVPIEDAAKELYTKFYARRIGRPAKRILPTFQKLCYVVGIELPERLFSEDGVGVTFTFPLLVVLSQLDDVELVHQLSRYGDPVAINSALIEAKRITKDRGLYDAWEYVVRIGRYVPRNYSRVCEVTALVMVKAALLYMLLGEERLRSWLSGYGTWLHNFAGRLYPSDDKRQPGEALV
ncbi:MAG: hypothetical protein NZ902_06640 [Acidilobaceae archaeon]|nr:hypothetical protein [Acidilobaceae archaeon]